MSNTHGRNGVRVFAFYFSNKKTLYRFRSAQSDIFSKLLRSLLKTCFLFVILIFRQNFRNISCWRSRQNEICIFSSKIYVTNNALLRYNGNVFTLLLGVCVGWHAVAGGRDVAEVGPCSKAVSL